MAIKSWDELRKIDVRPYCEERDGLLYLNWAKCISLLHENGAKVVRWIPIPDERTGTSLRMVDTPFTDSKGNTNRCYETRIKVVIDDMEYEMQSPVMNGANPVKDNSMSQQRVWNSMCRSFVKCVAINTGLGFDLWMKEEARPFQMGIPQDDAAPSAANMKFLKQMCEKHKVNLEYWVKSCNKTVATLTGTEVATMLQTLREKYGDE
jgi:hypothetical protein